MEAQLTNFLAPIPTTTPSPPSAAVIGPSRSAASLHPRNANSASRNNFSLNSGATIPNPGAMLVSNSTSALPFPSPASSSLSSLFRSARNPAVEVAPLARCSPSSSSASTLSSSLSAPDSRVKAPFLRQSACGPAISSLSSSPSLSFLAWKVIAAIPPRIPGPRVSPPGGASTVAARPKPKPPSPAPKTAPPVPNPHVPKYPLPLPWISLPSSTSIFFAASSIFSSLSWPRSSSSSKPSTSSSASTTSPATALPSSPSSIISVSSSRISSTSSHR